MKPTVILINGKKRAGKDYLAELLTKELENRNKTVEKFAFADPIKDIMAISLNISHKKFDKAKNDPGTLLDLTKFFYTEKNPAKLISTCTIRELIQYFGTDAMKKYFGKNVWVDLAQKRINESNSQYIILSDFRFPEEHISDITVNIFNNDLEEHDSHSSENALNDFHFQYYVDNTGKVDISDKVKELCDQICLH